MKKTLAYFDDAFKKLPDSKTAYRFKKEFIDEITDRANELTHRGIKDENVISDIIIGEHPDIIADFNSRIAAEKKKKRQKNSALLITVGVILYSLLVVVAFLLCLFVFRVENSWLVIQGGFTVLLIALGVFAIERLSRKQSVFHPVSRLILGICVMLSAFFVFMLLRFAAGAPHEWLAFLGGVIAMMAADVIYAVITGQRTAIIFALLYIPAVFALMYVILCTAGALSWHPGWLLILLGVVVDAAVIFARLISAGRQAAETEVEE